MAQIFGGLFAVEARSSHKRKERMRTVDPCGRMFLLVPLVENRAMQPDGRRYARDLRGVVVQIVRLTR